MQTPTFPQCPQCHGGVAMPAVVCPHCGYRPQRVQQVAPSVHDRLLGECQVYGAPTQLLWRRAMVYVVMLPFFGSLTLLGFLLPPDVRGSFTGRSAMLLVWPLWLACSVLALCLTIWSARQLMRRDELLLGESGLRFSRSGRAVDVLWRDVASASVMKWWPIPMADKSVRVALRPYAKPSSIVIDASALGVRSGVLLAAIEDARRGSSSP